MNIPDFIRLSPGRSLFLTGVVLVSAWGLASGTRELSAIMAKRRATPFQFYGDMFRGLNTALKSEQYLGYFTSQNLNDPAAGARYQHAQLGLVPLVLDPGTDSPGSASNLGRKFILFDCPDQAACLSKIREIGAAPLKAAGSGPILAVRP